MKVSVFVCVFVRARGPERGEYKEGAGHLRAPSGMCSGASQVFGRLRFGFRLATTKKIQNGRWSVFVDVLFVGVG